MEVAVDNLHAGSRVAVGHTSTVRVNGHHAAGTGAYYGFPCPRPDGRGRLPAPPRPGFVAGRERWRDARLRHGRDNAAVTEAACESAQAGERMLADFETEAKTR